VLQKAFRQGFYWPIAASDAAQIVRYCRGCQYFTRQVHTPAQELQTIPITWPFAVRGLDLLGPFKKAPEDLTHLLVTVDKFTKWIEAKALAKIGSRQAVDFIQDIIFRFGIPNSIITNNDTQFTGEKFLDLCDNNNIHVDWAAVAYPCTNRQVKRVNGMILQGLKPRILTLEGEDVHARLNTRARKWVTEVPSVLWSLWTTPNRSMGFTPLFMVYGVEAILPTDLQYGSPSVRAYQSDAVEVAQKDTIDLLEESSDTAVTRSARYECLWRYHACIVHPWAFQVRDLFLRWIQTKRGKHKLSSL
jgi:hypothetical protein